MEVTGKLANAPAPVTSWRGAGSVLLTLDQMNAYISVKFICEFKVVQIFQQPSFKLTLQKFYKLLQQKFVTPW